MRLFDLYLGAGQNQGSLRRARPPGRHRPLRLSQPGAHLEARRQGRPRISAKYSRRGRRKRRPFRLARDGFSGAGSGEGAPPASEEVSRSAGSGRSDRASGNFSSVFAANKSDRAARAARRSSFPAKKRETSDCARFMNARTGGPRVRRPKPLQPATSALAASTAVPLPAPAGSSAAPLAPTVGRNESRPCRHRRNQPPDVSAADAARSAGGDRRANRQTPRRDAMPGGGGKRAEAAPLVAEYFAPGVDGRGHQRR